MGKLLLLNSKNTERIPEYRTNESLIAIQFYFVFHLTQSTDVLRVMYSITRILSASQGLNLQ